MTKQKQLQMPTRDELQRCLEKLYRDQRTVAYTCFDCPVCGTPDARTSLANASCRLNLASDERFFSCEACNTEFEILPSRLFDGFGIHSVRAANRPKE